MAAISKKGNEAKKAKKEERERQLKELFDAMKVSGPYERLNFLFSDTSSWTRSTVVEAQGLVGKLMLEFIHNSDVCKNLEGLLKAMDSSVSARDAERIIKWEELPDDTVVDAVLFLKKHPMFGRVMEVPSDIKRRAWGFDFQNMEEPEEIKSPDSVAVKEDWV
jgi:hypothetical protein